MKQSTLIYITSINLLALMLLSHFNPFGQPAPLRGNIVGGLGIFTVFSYDEVLVNIEQVN
ncbi:MAG: hypothetical protein ACFCUU_18665 [Cyclobacteriaceae bacterium]